MKALKWIVGIFMSLVAFLFISPILLMAMTSFKHANTLALEFHDSIGHGQVTESDLREIALELGQSMQIGLSSLDRIGEIIRHMRNQTRAQSEGKSRLDLSRLLTDSLGLLQHAAAKSQVKLSLESVGVTWWLGEPGRMNQVLTNLVMNAIHACEDARQSDRYGSAVCCKKCACR